MVNLLTCHLVYQVFTLLKALTVNFYLKRQQISGDGCCHRTQIITIHIIGFLFCANGLEYAEYLQ